MPSSTVSAVLKRSGMGRLGRLGLQPARRYERARPGELVHIDVKRLGRITHGAGHRLTGRRHDSGRYYDSERVRRGSAGWECVHVAIDDATRLAAAEVLADETAQTAVGFLRRALAFYARHGIRAERVMTDNGAPYISSAHALACRELSLRHIRTRPRRPQTNGQSRALYPHDARRVGLRSDLPLIGRAHGGPSGLADPLQPAPTARRARPMSGRSPRRPTPPASCG